VPTAIDSLVVEIGLDPKGFTEGRQKLGDELSKARGALENFGKSVEREGTKIGEAFKFAKGGIMGLVGAFVGGEAASFIDKVASMDAHTMRFARTIGMSTQQLGLWNNLIRSVGGTAEDVTSTMGGLNAEFMDIKMSNKVPSPGMQQVLTRAGINPYQDNPDQAIMKMLQWLQPQKPQDQAYWLGQAGIQGNMALLLMDIMSDTGKMAELVKQLKEMGGASKKTGDEAVELQRKTSLLMAALDNLSRGTFPLLTAVVNAFAEGIKNTFGNSETSKNLLGHLDIVPDSPAGRLYKWLSDPKPMSLRDLFSSSAEASVPAAGSGGGGVGTRGDRNNNPGNIEYGRFAIAHGATGTDGRFAIFPNAETGSAAMMALLQSRYQGMTLAGIQKTWVGTGPDQGYLGSMMKATGLGANDVPNLNDPAVVKALMRGMTRGEGTHLPKSAAPGPQSSVTIGSINVASNKADPKAVADEVPDAIKRYSMLGGINTGLT